MCHLPPPYRLRLEEVAQPRDLWARCARLEPASWPILLDSGGSVERARYSILVHSPCAVHAVRARELAALGREERIARLFGPLDLPAAESGAACGGPQRLPFAGGWVGALDYEVGDWIAARSPGPPSAPLERELLWFGFYRRGWIRDRLLGRTGRLHLDGPAPDAPRAVAAPAARRAATAPRERVTRIASQGRFEAGVRRALELIRAGEIYQVNLSQRILEAQAVDELALYGALRRISPAPYAACLRLPGRAILSNSPELFFRRAGEALVTLPIKGTRARHATDAARDRRALEELCRSAKDRAELLMIVDLYRNDLGRLAIPGSVVVPGGLRSASYANVHHLLAEVRARIPARVGLRALLVALYPAGSISGAPKLRAQEAIRALEARPRGIYTGAIGYVDVRGRAAFNVAIRSAEVRAGRVELRMGAGIVADSDPAAEYREIMDKGSAWIAALGRAVEVCR
jgi:anthranilate/para-aminobenzoate synthase component I